jgi:formylglycine-generating enzyme required for sulfatase activity/protocatechuate 3,4-dioxygenase beta subunit
MKIMSYPYKLLFFLLLLSTNTLKATVEDFSLIPAGPFTMGNSMAEDTDITKEDTYIPDAPKRNVTLDAFYMGKYEVTKAEWDKVRNWAVKNGYNDLAKGGGKANDHPVHSISWHDALKWCNARSQMEGHKPVYYTNNAQTTIYKTGNINVANAMVKWNANGYRLPTEAEWEKAARGGLKGKRFPWGNTISQNQANYIASNRFIYDLSGKTVEFVYHPSYSTGAYSETFSSPVGSFQPNSYGLYDMAGNVWEWCWNRYGSYAAGNQINPRGPMVGSERIKRGGSWRDFADDSRVALRNPEDAAEGDADLGLRLVRVTSAWSRITGIVTGPDERTPLSGIYVTAWDDRDNNEWWNHVSTVITNGKGEYHFIGLKAGTYRVKFEDPGQAYGAECYNGKSSINSAGDINLSQSSTVANINASLSKASRIEGIVRADGSAAPLQGISVWVYEYDVEDDWWYWVTGVATGQSGAYSIGGLGAGTYRIEFRDPNGVYAFEAYNDASNIELGDDVVVAEASKVTGINASLAKASSISGKVTGIGGVKLTTIDVDLERLGNDGEWYWHTDADTDEEGRETSEDGEYKFSGLKAGVYRIKFEDESGRYALEYHAGAVEFDLAKNINLGKEQHLTINASMVKGSRITGKVIGPDGSPLPNVWIDALRLNSKGKWEWSYNAKANPDGTYEIGGLPNGTYRVAFFDDNDFYSYQFYDNKTSTIYFDLAKNFDIRSPQLISDVNGKFNEKAATVSGSAKDTHGKPLDGVRIEAYRKDSKGVWRLVFYGSLEIDDRGFYYPEMLPAGTYRFKFEKEGYITNYYGNSLTLNKAKDVIVRDGGHVRGIDAVLRKANSKLPQKIGAFAAISPRKFGSAPFAVKQPVATSKLPVSLKVKSGPAKISGNTVTLTGVGTVVLAANQSGNANYSAAKEVTTSFKVTK